MQTKTKSLVEIIVDLEQKIMIGTGVILTGFTIYTCYQAHYNNPKYWIGAGISAIATTLVFSRAKYVAWRRTIEETQKFRRQTEFIRGQTETMQYKDPILDHLENGEDIGNPDMN